MLTKTTRRQDGETASKVQLLGSVLWVWSGEILRRWAQNDTLSTARRMPLFFASQHPE
jgi:hypothetical protein